MERSDLRISSPRLTRVKAGKQVLVLFTLIILIVSAEKVSAGSTMEFFVTDHLGSPTMVIDEVGQVLETTDYLPFGQINYQDGIIDNDYGFTGKELDDSGLNYFDQRYYDSTIGKFISIDPVLLSSPQQYLIDPQQLNSYSYARNNPIVFIDPTGLSTATFNPMPEGGWQLDQVMGQFNGVTAHYNGIGSLREKHSCVEYAKRYMQQKYGITMGRLVDPNTLWTSGITKLNDNLIKAGSEYTFTQHINGTKFSLPQEGDLLIWTDNYNGHIMVVTESIFDSTTGQGHVETIDQNARNKAIHTYPINKTNTGYSIMKNKNIPMDGWLSPDNGIGSNNSNNLSVSVRQSQSSWLQRAWSNTRKFFSNFWKH